MAPLGRSAREGLSWPARRGVDLAGLTVGGVLGAVAAARGGKAVHPDGVTYRATLDITGSDAAPEGSRLLGTAQQRQALVRFSRSVGLPRPLPDLLGMAIRVVDAYGRDRHQDLLLVTSVDRPVLHHLFVPARDVQQRPYSSSLPYRSGDRRFLVGALPDRSSPRPDGPDEFARLAGAAATGRLTFTLAVAPVNGRFAGVGSLRVGAPLPAALDALRFNPFNTGGGLYPAGVLNRLRDYAYPLSQSAWALRGGRADAQREADRALRRAFG